MHLLSEEHIAASLHDAPGWSRAGSAISKKYIFKNFDEAMQFVNKLAIIAEKADHHPDIAISYNKVTLSLTTHSLGGLTKSDFELAKKIKELD